ncbi:response regulator [Maribacter forsetii]|uniref:response regulator n=1 Tax=Maribacter forsetii TaxID=444515 RepID=UPI00055DEC8C|nr:response regulator [Maribacter forsetii]
MNRKIILIVDDIYENLYLLRVILEEAGFKVIEANDGSDGLKKLYENSTVDLIISEILMPNMDGYLFCQACKKEKLFKDIPFVFYTSTYTEKLDEEFGLTLGVAKFLRKPIDYDEVLITVNEILDFGLKKGTNEVRNTKSEAISDGEVLELYSKRLIQKLEQKGLDLGQEVLERKRTEQLLIHENEILDLITVNKSLHEIFERLVLNYESIHEGYLGSISLLDDDGIHLILEAAPSLPKAFSLAIKRLAIGKNIGSCGTAAFLKKPIIVSDICTDKRWVNYKDIAEEYNLKSCWSLPIISKNNVVLGTFTIYSKTIKTPSDNEIRELNFSVSLPMQQQLLAYASNYNLLTTATLPHREELNKGETFYASLDHAIWFHRDFDITKWLLCSMDSPSASNSRGFARGSVYSRKGVLVASVAQEGLMRQSIQ